MSKGFIQITSGCWGDCFGSQRVNGDTARRDLRKKLNLVLGGSNVAFVDSKKEGEDTSRTTFRANQPDNQPLTTSRRVRTFRTQSLSKTPNPMSPQRSANHAPQPTYTLPQQNLRSAHSLSTKNHITISPSLTTIHKFSHDTQSGTTSTSKQKSPRPTQGLESSTPSKTCSGYKRTFSMQKETPTKFLLYCKDVKHSIIEDVEGVAVSSVPFLEFLRQIPSSQQPNQFAISRDPSKELIRMEEEKSEFVHVGL